MSFIDFLLQYYIYILVVLVLAIVTVIGFLADARNKKKKNKNVENVYGTSVDNNANPAVIPQPVNEQPVMPAQSENPNNNLTDMIEPVGDLNVVGGVDNVVAFEQPVAPVVPQVEVPAQPVAPAVEPVAPVVPQVEVPVQPVAPVVEPVAPVVPQVEVPVQPVASVVEPVAPKVEIPVEPINNNQSLNDFNVDNMFVTGDNK